jgi:hypothetical protein
MLGEPRWPVSGHITPFSKESGVELLALFGTAGQENSRSTITTVANLAMFVPFVLHGPVTVVKLFADIGSSSGNIDIGIYDEDGALIVSIGSTAQAGAGIQSFDITDTRIGPGRFYLAIVSNNATGGLVALSSGVLGRMVVTGMRWMSSAFPLPATAVFDTSTSAIDLVPLIGASLRTTF